MIERVPTLSHLTLDCAVCALGAAGLPRCFGFGPVSARVAFVGIAPSVRAAGAGRRGAFLVPLLARAQRYPGTRWGRYVEHLSGAARALKAIVEASGVSLWDVYSTNAVKCALPGNRAPTPAEVELCARTHLTTELASLPDLRTVICWGRVSGLPLGLSDFGQRVRVAGTLAEAVLLKHPVATLRRWTQVGAQGRLLASALGTASAPAPAS